MQSLREYSIKRTKLFNDCHNARTTADRENCTLLFIAHVWDWNSRDDIFVPMEFRPVIRTLMQNLANCVALCDNPVQLETIANGMRNCYLCGLDAE